MGNIIGGRRKGAKVMRLDGTAAFRVKPPASAGAVLDTHPGFQLLDSEEVKLRGVRSRPLAPDAPLRPGRLYFLVDALPRPPRRRAWSGALVRVGGGGGARERLESLKLARRSASDLSSFVPTSSPSSSVTAPTASPLSATAASEPVRLRMRLPKAQLDKLMSESRDGAEAAARIVHLCAANAGSSGSATPERGGILRTPPTTPEWGTGFVMPSTPDHADAKAGRKEKRTRFVALPDEIMASR